MVLDRAAIERLRRSPRRAAYYAGAVAALAADIGAAGSRLLVRRGPLLGTVRALAREAGAGAVAWSWAYDAASVARQRRLQAALEEAGIRVLGTHDAPAVSPEETAAARANEGGLGYRALAPYLGVWAAQARDPAGDAWGFADVALSSEPLPDAAELGAAASEATSEASVLAAFDAYLATSALNYRVARNVPGGEPTSRLSAALSFGVVSARTVLARLDARAGDPFLLTEERQSLSALRRSLAQRDFFLQLAWFFERRPDELLQARMKPFAFATRHSALDAWCEGRTGFALVDAGMRELAATGWMHPRVRAVAASFLCFDLGVDWRVGRNAWDALLVEDEPALAWGNWQWIAGVGADLAQVPRIYNPSKQLRGFDPRGAYVRRWIPELATVSDADLFDPAGAERRPQLALPLFDGHTYARPVVNHGAAARSYLRRYGEFVRAGQASAALE